MRRLGCCLMLLSLAGCASARANQIETVGETDTGAGAERVQAEVRSVDPTARRVELWVQFHWAPNPGGGPGPLHVLLEADTAFAPEGASLASLSPGDAVEVSLERDDAGAHAREVVLVDTD